MGWFVRPEEQALVKRIASNAIESVSGGIVVSGNLGLCCP